MFVIQKFSHFDFSLTLRSRDSLADILNVFCGEFRANYVAKGDSNSIVAPTYFVFTL